MRVKAINKLIKINDVFIGSVTPVIARSATTKQSIKEHSGWIASPQTVRNDGRN
jgi:hypothetical protein